MNNPWSGMVVVSGDLELEACFARKSTDIVEAALVHLYLA